MKGGYRSFLLRLFILAGLVVIYYQFEWIWLRAGLFYIITGVFGFFGGIDISGFHYDNFYIVVEGRTFYVSPNCTYIDLAFIIAPFWWRFGQPFAKNAGRQILIFTLILSANVGRVWVAIYFFAKGFSWQLFHNLPDMGLHIIVIAISVILALKNDVG